MDGLERPYNILKGFAPAQIWPQYGSSYHLQEHTLAPHPHSINANNDN